MKSDSSIQKTYADTGTYFPIPVLDAQEVAYFRNSFFTHERLLGEQVKKLTSFAQLHLHIPWAYQLATHPKIIEAVKQVLGPNVLVHGSTIFHKHPNDQKYVSWHQDSYNMQLNSFEYVSAWVALADSTIENGCLRVIPGTQHKEYHHDRLPEKNNMLMRGSTVDVTQLGTDAVDVELAAGEMSLHHVNLVHGSNANTSGERRIGYAIRYISDKVSQNSFHHQVILAAGAYEGKEYELLEKPPEGSLEACIVKQRIAHAAYAKKIGLPGS